MDLAIIVPVHNAEKYLPRCIKSLLEATASINAKIILLNDASTDNSWDIMSEYKRKFKDKLEIYNRPHSGAGAIRNYGVELAKLDKAKYVWFVDADDTVSPDSAHKLLNKAKEKDADLVMMRAKRIYQNGKTSYLSAVDESTEDYKSRFIRYGMGPWQVLIKRTWWKSHGFRFKEGIIQEDMELMSALILYTDKYASIDEPLYNYYETPESVLHKKDFTPHVYDIFPALTGLYERFKEAHAEQKYYSELEWFFIWNLLIDSAKDFAKYPEARSGYQKSREMLRKYFPHWRHNKFLRAKPLKLKLLVRLNYYK
jgi:glycosyltransferase involved in cell wall biosynthesis